MAQSSCIGQGFYDAAGNKKIFTRNSTVRFKLPFVDLRLEPGTCPPGRINLLYNNVFSRIIAKHSLIIDLNSLSNITLRSLAVPVLTIRDSYNSNAPSNISADSKLQMCDCDMIKLRQVSLSDNLLVSSVGITSEQSRLTNSRMSSYFYNIKSTELFSTKLNSSEGSCHAILEGVRGESNIINIQGNLNSTSLSLAETDFKVFSWSDEGSTIINSTIACSSTKLKNMYYKPKYSNTINTYDPDLWQQSSIVLQTLQTSQDVNAYNLLYPNSPVSTTDQLARIAPDTNYGYIELNKTILNGCTIVANGINIALFGVTITGSKNITAKSLGAGAGTIIRADTLNVEGIEAVELKLNTKSAECQYFAGALCEIEGGSLQISNQSEFTFWSVFRTHGIHTWQDVEARYAPRRKNFNFPALTPSLLSLSGSARLPEISEIGIKKVNGILSLSGDWYLNLQPVSIPSEQIVIGNGASIQDISNLYLIESSGSSLSTMRVRGTIKCSSVYNVLRDAEILVNVSCDNAVLEAATLLKDCSVSGGTLKGTSCILEKESQIGTANIQLFGSIVRTSLVSFTVSLISCTIEGDNPALGAIGVNITISSTTNSLTVDDCYTSGYCVLRGGIVTQCNIGANATIDNCTIDTSIMDRTKIRGCNLVECTGSIEIETDKKTIIESSDLLIHSVETGEITIQDSTINFRELFTAPFDFLVVPKVVNISNSDINSTAKTTGLIAAKESLTINKAKSSNTTYIGFYVSILFDVSSIVSDKDTFSGGSTIRMTDCELKDTTITDFLTVNFTSCTFNGRSRITIINKGSLTINFTNCIINGILEIKRSADLTFENCTFAHGNAASHVAYLN